MNIDTDLLDMIERHKLNVSFNSRHNAWTVQMPDQVVGCIAHHAQLRPALGRAALELMQPEPDPEPEEGPSDEQQERMMDAKAAEIGRYRQQMKDAGRGHLLR